MNIDKLKKVIQEANPEIMELKFGCEIIYKDIAFDVLRKMDEGHCFIEYFVNGDPSILMINPDKDKFKILGRPIRLADVLIALGTNHPVWMQTTSDKDGVTISKELNRVLYFWKFEKNNLDDQSDETKQFLIDLLVKKEKE